MLAGTFAIIDVFCTFVKSSTLDPTIEDEYTKKFSNLFEEAASIRNEVDKQDCIDPFEFNQIECIDPFALMGPHQASVDGDKCTSDDKSPSNLVIYFEKCKLVPGQCKNRHQSTSPTVLSDGILSECDNGK